MKCETYTLPDTGEFLSVLNDRVCSERIPLCGSIDLTNRCNLECVHCYLRGRGDGEEMSTAEVTGYIDQAVDAGCLFLLLTGGEPLARKDFRKIYEHAKRAGLLVSIFTNGTLIDEKMADFLAGFPPHTVEISIYGSRPGVHDGITGVTGSFEQTMRGCRLLKERGIDVSLKTILMTLNRDEMEGLLDIASVYGVRFRADGAIFPRLNGDRSPLGLRLKPEEVVEREFMIPQRREHWRQFMAKVGGLEPAESLYDCGAGVSCFHITAAGRLQPCIMAQKPGYELAGQDFADAWREMAVISERQAGSDYPCSDCERRLLCDSCPGFFGLETGDEGIYSEYVCNIAKERSMRLAP